MTKDKAKKKGGAYYFLSMVKSKKNSWDNMITFNGISVYNILNFKFKRYSL
jgi:hypothetical protein